MNIQSRLRVALDKYRDSIAIEYGDRHIRYPKLKSNADAIRRKILSYIQEQKPVVGVFLEDRVEYISSIIGLLFADCIFAPLDYHLPDRRLASLIQSASIKYILTHSRSVKRVQEICQLAHITLEVVVIDESITNEGKEEAVNEIKYDCQDPIYIFFTSGSTGLPKAILGKNESLLHFVETEINMLNIREGTRVSQFAAMGFDAILRDIFVPLLSGGTICIPERREIILDGTKLREWIHQANVNIIHCTPSIFKLMNSQVNHNSYPQLKYVLMAGEAIKPSDLKKWYSCIGERVQLVNLYGATETTMVKVVYFIKPEDSELKTIPVGKAMAEARVYILDEKLDECEKGVVGEICIETPYMTLGYYNDEQLTKQKFVKHQLKQGEIVKIYRTGDLGRALMDGNIECLGRMDRQIKIRGNRIELAEIESHLSNYPSILDCVVHYFPTDEAESGLLAAYYVPETEISNKELARFMKMRLPDYMLPNQYVRIEKVPLNANGKVDYSKLPGVLQKESVIYIAPKNEIEMEIVGICSDVLGVASVGLMDDIFELGAHSLNVMNIISRVRQTFETEIPLEYIFENSSVENIANYVAESKGLNHGEIERVVKKQYYRLSPPQKRIFIDEQFDDKKTSYNISTCFELDIKVSLPRFEQAVRELVGRHESLRTTFRIVDGEPVQYIHDNINSLEIAILQSNSSEFLSSIIKPYHLEELPLFRIAVMMNDFGVDKVLFDIHHIIADGKSLPLIVRDLYRILASKALPELLYTYVDYSEWFSNKKTGDELEKQEVYWLEHLAGYKKGKGLPTDFQPSKERKYSGAKLTREISEKETSLLNKAAIHHKVTLFMLLYSVFSIVYSKFVAHDDIVIGSPVEGRRYPGLENMVGNFVNILPIRSSPKDNKSFRVYLGEIKSVLLGAYANDDYQIDSLLKKLRLQRNSDLFETLFFMQYLDDFYSNGKSFEYFESDTLCEAENLRVMVFSVKGKLVVHVRYSSELYKMDTVQRLLNNFLEAVKIITKEMDVLIKDITLHPIAPLPEKSQSIGTFNFNM